MMSQGGLISDQIFLPRESQRTPPPLSSPPAGVGFAARLVSLSVLMFSCPCFSSCAVGALSQSQAHPLLGSLTLPGRPLQPQTHAQLEHFLPLRVNSTPPLSLFPNFNTVRHCALWLTHNGSFPGTLLIQEPRVCVENTHTHTDAHKIKCVSLVWQVWDTLVVWVTVCDLRLKISSHLRITAKKKMRLKSVEGRFVCHWLSKVPLILLFFCFVLVFIFVFFVFEWNEICLALCLQHPAIKQKHWVVVSCRPSRSLRETGQEQETHNVVAFGGRCRVELSLALVSRHSVTSHGANLQKLGVSASTFWEADQVKERNGQHLPLILQDMGSFKCNLVHEMDSKFSTNGKNQKLQLQLCVFPADGPRSEGSD